MILFHSFAFFLSVIVVVCIGLFIRLLYAQAAKRPHRTIDDLVSKR